MCLWVNWTTSVGIEVVQHSVDKTRIATLARDDETVRLLAPRECEATTNNSVMFWIWIKSWSLKIAKHSFMPTHSRYTLLFLASHATQLVQSRILLPIFFHFFRCSFWLFVTLWFSLSRKTSSRSCLTEYNSLVCKRFRGFSVCFRSMPAIPL